LASLKFFSDTKFQAATAKRWLIVIFFCAAYVLSLAAGELKVGDAVPLFSASDQFGKEFKFQAGLRFLLLGFDMGASKTANLKLADLGSGWLEKQGAVYVLDIHTMPAIARVFALPKLRKYPHRIILAEAESLLAPFPRQPERLTVLVLTPGGKIKEIRFWNPASEALAARLNPG
jgi:hypothetical protein